MVEHEGSVVCRGKRGFYLRMVGNYRRGVGRPGNTSVRDLLADSRFIGAVLEFLTNTGGQGEGGCFV